MGKEAQSPTLPPIPDLATIAMVIRLAEAAAAERYDQRPASYPRYDLGDCDLLPRKRPAWDELLAFLSVQPDEVVAGLNGVYRLGDHPHPVRGVDLARYRAAFDLEMNPLHRAYGAYDLAAKATLASGLRRGLEHLGLRLEASRADATGENDSPTL
jgi:hypothetical protein